MDNSTVIGLLAIIAVSEVVRLVLTHKPTTKKEHFKQKLEGTEKMVWDLEFKIFKTREIREDIRQEYDFMKHRVIGFEERLKVWDVSKDGNEEEKKKHEDQKVLAERDMNRLEAQLKQLDIEISGSKPTNEYPDGVTGITQQIDSLKELQGMVKDWLKKI